MHFSKSLIIMVAATLGANGAPFGEQNGLTQSNALAARQAPVAPAVAPPMPMAENKDKGDKKDGEKKEGKDRDGDRDGDRNGDRNGDRDGDRGRGGRDGDRDGDRDRDC
ncbi:unnamed protein product, partial [Colletotrichum noveboracense]